MPNCMTLTKLEFDTSKGGTLRATAEPSLVNINIEDANEESDTGKEQATKELEQKDTKMETV